MARVCLACLQQTRWNMRIRIDINKKKFIGQAQARSQYGLVKRTYGLFCTNTTTDIVIVKQIMVG